MTTPIGKRLAVNPIPYWSKAGKTREVFFVIEIDEPSVDSRFESHQIAYQWAQLNLPA
jgi:hypothetical protein